MIQPRTSKQKTEFKKIAKKADKENYVWDSFTKRYLPAKFFQKDSTRETGFQSTNKFIKNSRFNLTTYMEKISKLPKADQKLLMV